MRTKKRIVSLILAFSFVLVQAAGLFGAVVHAEENTNVEVYVEGNTGMIASGSTDALSASLALDNVLKDCGKSSAVVDGSGFISSIDGLSNDTVNWSRYWMLAVDRNGTYVAVNEGVNTLMLQGGDKLIVYFSGMNTYTANKISYSTNSPNTKLTITLNNEQQDWYTGNMVVSPISSPTMKAWIDGQPAALDQNKIVINNGLSAGTHYLRISDYQTDESKMPCVVDDTFSFVIENPTCSVRVEGLTSTMLEGSAQGATALEIVEKVLGQNGVAYSTLKSPWGEYITEIGGLKENDIKTGTGWMYYVKSKSSIISPDTGIDSYVPGSGDEIVLYFTDFNVPYVNSITFTPDVVPVSSSFDMKFSYSYTDWSDWANPVTATKGISGALVTIDGTTNYVTDASGEITIAGGLGKGTHTYRISGYNSGSLSTVIMDEGSFTIDGVSSPSFDLSKNTYESNVDQNNLLVNKDIEGSITDTAGVVKGYSDPWANISMQKLGLTGNCDYLNLAYADISKNGVADYSNTELEKLIFGLTASGFNPYSFAGADLVSELYSRSADTFQVPDTIYALLAMEYANIPDDYKVNSQVLVERLLSLMVTDGTSTGWSLSGSMDPDITGAAVSALSSHMDNQKVAAAVNKSVLSLENKVKDDGYVLGHYGVNSETNAFVILGLLSVGVNPEGVSTLSDGSSVNFAMPSGDLVSAMLSFKTDGGLFRHDMEGKGNAMATEECLRALIALKEFKASGEAYNYYSSDINAAGLKAYTPQPGTAEQAASSGTAQQASTTASSNTGGRTASSATAYTAAANPAADTAAATEAAAGTSSSGQGSSKSQDAGKIADNNYFKIGGGLIAVGIIGAAAYILLGRKDDFI